MRKFLSSFYYSHFSNSKGISLIALLITIIVLIIIAGITFFSTDDALKSAQEAKFETDLRKLVDNLKIYHEKAELESFTYKRNKLSWDGLGTQPVNTGKVQNGVDEDTADYIFNGIPPYFANKISIEKGKITYKYTKFTDDEKIWLGNVDQDFIISSVVDIGTVRITFEANGGILGERIRELEENTQIGRLPIPRRNSYAFAGWYTEENGGEQIDETTMITSDITYYAHWEEAVAQLGDEYFSTVASAIEAAPNTGEVKALKLLTNVSEKVIVNEGKNIIFNLQNYTLSYSGGTPTIENYGTLSISNGSINSSDSTIKNFETGLLTVDGLILNSTSTVNSSLSNEYGTVLVRGNTQLNCGNKKAIYNHGGSFVITGGVITSTHDNGVNNFSSGRFTVNGSVEINSKIVNNNSEMTIAGGTINGNITNDRNATMLISKESTSNPTIINNPISNTNSATLTISNGIINNKIENDAILNISGGTIDFPKSVSSTIVLNKSNGTLNITGGTINATTDDSDSRVCITNNGKMTMGDGSLTSTKGNTIVNTGNKADLEVYGGTIYASLANALRNQSAGKAVISGGNFTSDVKSGDSAAVYNTGSNTKMEVKGGTLYSESQSALFNANSADMIISGGDISSKGTTAGAAAAINFKSSSTALITGGYIHGVGSGDRARQAIYNDGATVTITGNPIFESNAQGTRGTVQNQKGTMYIRGGTIRCTNAAGVYIVAGTVIIGEDDDTIDTSTPYIQGGTKGGIMTNNINFKLYDGKILVKYNNKPIANTSGADATSRADCNSSKNHLVTGEQETIGTQKYNKTYVAKN